jgi:hypothetical protein
MKGDILFIFIGYGETSLNIKDEKAEGSERVEKL